MTTESVTVWLEQLRHGDTDAARQLWERYFSRLARLARDHLGGLHRGAADEEDVVVSVFTALCEGLAAGRFPDLNDRHELWRLLLTMTERRAVDLVRHEQAQRRGGDRRADEVDVALLVDASPTPRFAAELADEVERLLKKLDGDVSGRLRQVAIWKMEGFSNEEIAVRLGCVERTVERKVRTIRKLWSGEGLT